MIVQSRDTDDPDVLPVRTSRMMRWARAARLALRRRRARFTRVFNHDRSPLLAQRKLLSLLPPGHDVSVLHWTNRLLTSQLISRVFERTRAPIVWMLHDQEPLTGGCHYASGCMGFTEECGRCPQLGSSRLRDRSWHTWHRKHRLLAPIPITFVTPTGWTLDRLRESRLFGRHRAELVPLPIDPKVFAPGDRLEARQALGLATRGERVLMFGATHVEEPRKGMEILVEALDRVRGRLGPEAASGVRLLSVGAASEDFLKRLPLPCHHLGLLMDDHVLARAYQAADLFLCPSLEDAGPLMIPEAMMCRTPAVAFRSGGAPDVIRHMENGYLTELGDVEGFAQGILTLLASADLERTAAAAHEGALARHAADTIARQHAALYESLTRGP